MTSFYKAMRSEDHKELLKHPGAYAILSLIAFRAKRTLGFSSIGLQPNEALLGDYKAVGLTRQKYRTALYNLEKWGFITTRTTNKGTIAKLIKSTVFDINCETCNHQDNHMLTTDQPSSNHQVTTNKKLKNNKKNKAFSSDSDEYRLASLLLSLIKASHPRFKNPNLQSWAKHIDLAIRRDGRTPQELEEVIRWVQRDHFWRSNILSTSSLRKQYDKLYLKMKGDENEKQISKTPGAAPTQGNGGNRKARKYDTISGITAAEG